jgi:hypothetical protein
MLKAFLEFALQYVLLLLVIIGAFTFYWKSRGEL